MGTTTERERLGARLRRQYEAGASIRALAREVGHSEGWVRRLLLDAGTTLRGRRLRGLALIEQMVREGRALAPTTSRHHLPPPLVPLRDGPSLSDIVIAHRGGR